MSPIETHDVIRFISIQFGTVHFIFIIKCLIFHHSLSSKLWALHNKENKSHLENSKFSQLFVQVAPTISILPVIRLILPLEAYRFRQAKIVLLWEHNTRIEASCSKDKNQHGKKKKS